MSRRCQHQFRCCCRCTQCRVSPIQAKKSKSVLVGYPTSNRPIQHMTIFEIDLAGVYAMADIVVGQNTIAGVLIHALDQH